MHTLEDLENGALRGARHVRLTQLGLNTFPMRLLELADTLEILDLSGNRLQELPPEFSRFTRLRILFASNNPFTALPPVLGQCPRLEMVGFKACQIHEVADHSLPPQLRWLILTDNRITQLPASLGQRPRLQKLMLACNQLQSLPDLAQASNLELVRIASNCFTQLPPQLLALPKLAWLGAAGNPLTRAAERQVLAQNQLPQLQWHDVQTHALLGEGASGRIYAGQHAQFQQPLAIKIYKAAATSDGTPLSEIAASLQAGQHPHLLTPLALLHSPAQQPLACALPQLASGYQNLANPPSFDSCTRDVYAPSFRLPQATVQRVLTDMRNALCHLHAQGVVHGDFYAHNILLEPRTGHAWLSDFGAALVTQHLPATEAAQLQALDWRAYHHLAAELHDLTDG